MLHEQLLILHVDGMEVSLTALQAVVEDPQSTLLIFDYCLLFSKLLPQLLDMPPTSIAGKGQNAQKNDKEKTQHVVLHTTWC